MAIKHLDITYSKRRDEDLWKDLKSGSEQALVMIYDKYIDSLFAYGRHFIRNDAILEDCIQDVFVEIWIKKDRLSNTDSINFYLLKCLKLKIFKVVKKNQREILRNQISDYFHIADEDTDTADPDISIKLKHALDSLNPRQKEILILKFYNQLTTEEICKILELTKKQVYNDTAIAIGKIRKILLSIVVIIFFLLYNYQ